MSKNIHIKQKGLKHYKIKLAKRNQYWRNKGQKDLKLKNSK